MDLFDLSNEKMQEKKAPLAFRMRPASLDDIVGQEHLLSKGAAFRNALDRDQLHSLVLFGPAGTGKTTIAQIIAQMTASHFQILSAVNSGTADLRNAAAEAGHRQKFHGIRTVLFIDEIHRFNKNQQDSLLPFVENGTLTIIGATTENPLYELNHALISRLQIYILKPLEPEHISIILKRAINDREKGFGLLSITYTEEALLLISNIAKGDARMALNVLESIVNSFVDNNCLNIDASVIEQAGYKPIIKYDKHGSYHYDNISAFIKSIRGSDPDAALYWLAAMLEGGEDPKFIARRLMVHAAEDIGLADPLALLVAVSATQALEFIGMPEARIPLAEATIYLACAPKSNSTVVAINSAIKAVRNSNKIQIPIHLQNPKISHAGDRTQADPYKYPHDFGGYVKQSYLPEGFSYQSFYKPGNNIRENKIKQFLNKLPNNQVNEDA